MPTIPGEHKLSAEPTPYSPKLDNLRGILWMLAAVLALTLMFAIIKQLVRELPVFVVALMRCGFALLLMVPWMVRVGMEGLATRRIGGHFARAFFGITSFVCAVYALQKLLMADAIVLSFTSALWAIVVSALILREVAGPRRIAATLAGFAGVLLIVKPQAGTEPAAVIALAGALLTSFAMIALKRLSTTEPPTRTVFYFFLLGSLMLLLPATLVWKTPTLVQLGWLLGAGVLAAVGQDCLARAYDAGEVTIVAPFDFLRLPVAAVLGFALFDEVPDRSSVVGMLIILAASLYIARRES